MFSIRGLIALALIAGVQIAHAEESAFFVGRMGGKVCLIAHERICAQSPTAIRTDYEQELRIASPVSRSMRETQSFVETTEGRLISFRYESEQGVLEGKITHRNGSPWVDATLWKGGKAYRIRSKLLPDCVPVGTIGQRLRLDKLRKPGDSVVYHTLSLANSQLSTTESRAKLTRIEKSGTRLVEVTNGSGRISEVTLDSDNRPIRLCYMVLGERLEVRRVKDVRLALVGADLPAVGVIPATGPPPSHSAARNRYALPARLLALISASPFQEFDKGGGVVVLAKPRLTAGGPPSRSHLLAATNTLETQRPELRAWVSETVGGEHSVAERIERLENAVSSRVQLRRWRFANATAFEAFVAREGDCTELANLVCAALRIAEIPARREVGLVYSFPAGQWLAHSWVSAFDREQAAWVHVDPVYPTLKRSLYIAVGLPEDDMRIRTTKLLASLSQQPIRTITGRE